MHKKQRIFVGAGLLVAAAYSQSAGANAIINGEFTSDLSGWSMLASSGSVLWNAGHAELSTGSGTDPFSAVLVQGDDGSFSFPAPILLGASDYALAFDATFVDLGADSSETGSSGGNTDQLSVWVYDADSSASWLAASVSLATTGGPGFSFNLTTPTDLRGKRVAFSFELADEDDGFNSLVQLDNVRLLLPPPPPAAAPEPGALALMLAGLAGLRRSRRAK